jgi:hypothetical protein
MNIGKAFAVFQQIESKKYTKDEKYEAIHDVINAATINSITKRQVLDVASYLFEEQNKYRWHDLRKNPDDLPDVEHRRKAYFHVVQAGKEARPAILQYKKEFGFGIYNEFGNGPKFTGIDTDLVAPVVAWKEIEEFESEKENED